jgi:hypothetical protein
MNEQLFLDAYAASYPKDPTSQAIASERARAHAAGWGEVMGRATAGQKINRDTIKREADAAFMSASTPVKITAARRDSTGELAGSIVVELASRQLAFDRLVGMTDALVSLCDAYSAAGARAGWKPSVGQ